MIKAAISSLKERTGSSVQAITKYVEANYKLPDNFKKVLSNQLKKLAAEGKLVKVKASYKLGDALKKAPKKPKAKVRSGTSVCFFVCGKDTIKKTVVLTTDGDFYLHTQPGKHYAEGEGCEEARGEEAEEGCKEARCQEAEEGCEEARGQEAEGEEAQGGEEVSDEQRARLFRSLLCSSLNIHKKHNKKNHKLVLF